MAIITRRITSNLNYQFTIPCPGSNNNQNANLIIPASVVDLDLLTLTTEDSLWTLQPQLLSLQRNGDIAVTGTMDTSSFDYDGVGSLHADSSPEIRGDIKLVSGTGITLSQTGQNITVTNSGVDTGITQLTSDVTAGPGSGSQAATVASVGGSSASNVHSAELAANAATDANTASTIVKRDASGNFSAGTITASLTGHSSLDLSLTGGTLTGPLGIGEAPGPSAILDLASTTQGFLPPRMTTTQRNNIVNPASGLFTVVDFTALSGAVATVNGIALTEGVDWTAATSNDATALSLAGAINANTGSTLCTGVEFTNVTIASANFVVGSNSITIATSDVVNLTVSGPTLSGEVDPSTGLQIYNTTTSREEFFNGSVWGPVGSEFPIGTILQVPSTPINNGTWLACDGSSISQTTYANLFSNIGHGYMNYTPTITPGTILTPNSNIIWTGTYWAYCNGTDYRYTSTGISLNNVVLGTTANSLTSYNVGGVVIAYVFNGTAANISTDAGVNFVLHTLPAAIAGGIRMIAPGNSTTNFLYPVGRVVYTMADGGTTWATNTNALPVSAASGNLKACWWDGTNWNVADTTNLLLYQTSDPSGITGWAASSILYYLGGSTTNGNSFSINNSPNIVIFNSLLGSLSTLKSSDSLLTVTRYNQTFAPPRNALINFVTWNGFCYVAVAASGSSIFTDMYTTADGTVWHISTGNLQFTSPTSTSIATSDANSICDTSNGKFIFAAFSGSNIVELVLMTPTSDPSTQFSLPNQPGYFIRAL